MSGILNVGARALMTNQAVLQTTGNNIANVNTPGYSRQTAQLATVAGQFSGSGYIGKGVELQTITRAYDQFLTRQSTLAGAVASGDTARADKLRQLETLFQGGTDGLGASVNDMLNAFADVASAPTDLTARTVALTRVNETALRMRNTATSLDDLQLSLTQEMDNKVGEINNMATSIASVNEKIARATGNGQTPNDLLDQRDQLIRDLNKLVQTTQIPADDGTVGVFIGGSQALVLGRNAAQLTLTNNDFGDPLSRRLNLVRNGQTVELNQDTLGGGEIPGLLRFQNNDMIEARNLLGRYTLAIATSMNAQHKLGLDLDGAVGTDLFSIATLSAANNNIFTPQPPATLNTGTAALTLAIDDVSKFVASDYEINFTGASAGNIIRKSDGKITAFGSVPITLDGLTIAVGSGTANAGDRFLIKPFSTAASTIQAQFSSPRGLAVASPVIAGMGTTNTGTLQLVSVQARTNPPLVQTSATPITLTFNGAGGYTRSDTGATVYAYTSGQPIEGTVPATTPLSEWSVVLQGTPRAGDTVTIVGTLDAVNNKGVDYKLNAGNANLMMQLRDVAMFDGATLTDGYANLISQVAVRSQSASYSANVSNAIADQLEKDRTAVAGVNLDEEAAKLLQFQQAYQASAKVIQVAQGIFDTLIQTMR
ncbi:MAG: flagellar hook-associated protein FlgK [Rhodoferax sp.]